VVHINQSQSWVVYDCFTHQPHIFRGLEFPSGSESQATQLAGDFEAAPASSITGRGAKICRNMVTFWKLPAQKSLKYLVGSPCHQFHPVSVFGNPHNFGTVCKKPRMVHRFNVILLAVLLYLQGSPHIFVDKTYTHNIYIRIHTCTQ